MSVLLRDADDQDDAFENGILRDGKSYRVKFADADSLGRAVASHFAKSWRGAARVTDAAGNAGAALSRPGFRILNDAIGDAMKAESYRQYDADAQRAYLDADNSNQLTGAGSAAELRGSRPGDRCTVRQGAGAYGVEGSDGRLRQIGGKLVCVADGFDLRATAPAPTDASKQDAKDHRQKMNLLLDQLDRELEGAWARVRP
jgi:hypothetical protein